MRNSWFPNSNGCIPRRMILQLLEIRENSNASIPSLCVEMVVVLISAEKQHIFTMVARELTIRTGVNVVVIF